MHAVAGLLLGMTFAVPVGEGRDARPAPKDAERLQGVWKVTAAETAGRPVAAGRLQLPAYTFVMVGDQYVFSAYGGTFTLDPESRTVDLAVTAGRYKGKTLPGRYDLRGDTLTLHLPVVPPSDIRPAEPKPGQPAGGTVYTFERDGQATKERAEALLKERTAALTLLRERGGFGAPAVRNPPAGTAQMLQQILDRLDRMERRLEAIEKKVGAGAGEKE